MGPLAQELNPAPCSASNVLGRFSDGKSSNLPFPILWSKDFSVYKTTPSISVMLGTLPSLIYPQQRPCWAKNYFSNAQEGFMTHKIPCGRSGNWTQDLEKKCIQRNRLDSVPFFFQTFIILSVLSWCRSWDGYAWSQWTNHSNTVDRKSP